MLDKTKVYAVRSGNSEKSAPPSGHFRRVKILFEDNISFYVESLTVKDAAGFGRRYSVKKHCFVLIAINESKKENKMRKFQVGDVVNMHDGSYCFGIQNGKYVMNCGGYVRGFDDREGLIVVDTDLDVMQHAEGRRTGPYTEVNDLLVTNGKGGYWFTQSGFVRLAKPKRTLTLDTGEKVTISDESYQELRKNCD